MRRGSRTVPVPPRRRKTGAERTGKPCRTAGLCGAARHSFPPVPQNGRARQLRERASAHVCIFSVNTASRASRRFPPMRLQIYRQTHRTRAVLRSSHFGISLFSAAASEAARYGCGAALAMLGAARYCLRQTPRPAAVPLLPFFSLRSFLKAASRRRKDTCLCS